MSQFFQRDEQTTALAHAEGWLTDSRSYITRCGHLQLEGEDYTRQRKKVIALAKNRCHRCAEWFPSERLEIDHEVPRGRGGPDDLKNLRPMCAPGCHRGGEGSKHP